LKNGSDLPAPSTSFLAILAAAGLMEYATGYVFTSLCGTLSTESTQNAPALFKLNKKSS
jgi:hypothetical protein